MAYREATAKFRTKPPSDLLRGAASSEHRPSPQKRLHSLPTASLRASLQCGYNGRGRGRAAAAAAPPRLLFVLNDFLRTREIIGNGPAHARRGNDVGYANR